MIDYAIILTRKYKNAEWTLNGDGYAGLTWVSDSTKPTKDELDSLWTEVQEEIKLEIKSKEDAKTTLLSKLGITQEEAQLILGGSN
jgi:hypothetical protein